MKKLRVELYHTYENDDLCPNFEKEFCGKVGTIVFADKSAWGEFSGAVELDIPHSIFGNFANVVYFSGNRKNTLMGKLVDDTTIQDISTFCFLMDGNSNADWSNLHTKNGNPLSFVEVEGIYNKKAKRIFDSVPEIIALIHKKSNIDISELEDEWIELSNDVDVSLPISEKDFDTAYWLRQLLIKVTTKIPNFNW